MRLCSQTRSPLPQWLLSPFLSNLETHMSLRLHDAAARERTAAMFAPVTCGMILPVRGSYIVIWHHEGWSLLSREVPSESAQQQ